MLKKLRRKFIAIAMLIRSIVLIAIVGMINIANYISTNEARTRALKLIAGNGKRPFPDSSNSRRTWEWEAIKKMMKTQTPAQKAQAPIQKTQTTHTFGNTADESTNKETPTLKEPPSGRTDVQPPEDMNLQSYCRLKIFFYMHFTH